MLHSFRLALIPAVMALAACSGGEDGGSTDPIPTTAPTTVPTTAPTTAPTSNAAEFSSDSGGIVGTGTGQTLAVNPIAIPQDASGNAGSVTFSVETVSSAPAPLPGTVDGIGSVAKFGPDGFDFAWPLAMTLPLPESTTNLTGLKYMRYDQSSGSWVNFPGLSLTADENGTVNGVSVPAYDLGFDSLATLRNAPGAAATEKGATTTKLGNECTTCDGAMRIAEDSCSPDSSGECHFYLVAKTYTPTADWQKSQFESFLSYWNGRNSTRCGWNAATARFEAAGDGNCGMWRTGSEAAGSPAAVTLMPIQQGNWEFCVTKSEYALPGASLPIPGRWTYNSLLSVNINQASHNSCQTFACWSNVVNVSMPNSGWEEPAVRTQCPANPNPSVPVGTGNFQATLTWSNTSTSTADLDLHLYGPNGEHVYYGNEISADGKIQLDRDWQDEQGSAVENIFTVGNNNLPSGAYRLSVIHFDGTKPISFTVRVVRNGTSSTFTRTFNSGGSDEIDILSFNQ